MFPAGYVPDGKGAERCCAKVSGDRFADLVDPRGVNADVQEAGHRCRPGLHDTGFEVAGGAGDADPLHMGEQAQRGRFVGYAVLQADNRRLGGATWASSESAARVCWLFTARSMTWLARQSICRG